jgi:hypothetical protein
VRDTLYVTVRTDHPAWATATDERTGRTRKAYWHEHAGGNCAAIVAVARLLNATDDAETPEEATAEDHTNG